jgi:flavin reductase (DIM6/NTAB) family NADH-FMN oxidoreductase RutF
VSELAIAGLESATADLVDAPYVADCPVVMECEVFKEVDLGDAPNTFIIGEVRRVHVDPDVPRVTGTQFLDSEMLQPMARLWGPTYAFLGEIVQIPRPRIDG